MTTATAAAGGTRFENTDVRQLGTILGVWAHPDDEAFLSAGLMTLAAAGGQRVVCVTATAGERGTDDPVRFPPERLARLRHQELAKSLRAVGVEEHRTLSYIDGTLETVDSMGASARLVNIINEVAPDTIVTFGPDGFTGHRDHRAVSAWTTSARQEAAPGSRLLHATHTAEWWYDGPGAWLDVLVDHDDPALPPVAAGDDLVVDLRLSGDILNRKVAALEAHRSQVAGIIATLGPRRFRTWVACEQFIESSGPVSR